MSQSAELPVEEAPLSAFSWKKLAVKMLFALFVTFSFLIILLSITIAGIAWYGWTQLNTFTDAAGVTVTELKSTIETGLNTQPTTDDGTISFLILGTDQLDTRTDSAPLTDTIMLATLSLDSGQVNLLSLPRDIYNQPYQTKINALYAYGQERNPDEPTEFPEMVLEEMIAQPIQYTVVISIDQLAELIDMIGGITVDVPEPFTDTRFPRTDVDVTVVRDPDLLYETISFDEGPQQMDGATALKYIRSRYSDNQNQNNDLARSARQKQVISAIISRLKTREIVTDPAKLGELYAWYNQLYAPVLPVSELIAVGRELWSVRDQIELQSHQLSIYPASESGALTNPPVSKYNGQWVYEIRDQEAFQQEVKDALWN